MDAYLSQSGSFSSLQEIVDLLNSLSPAGEEGTFVGLFSPSLEDPSQWILICASNSWAPKFAKSENFPQAIPVQFDKSTESHAELYLVLNFPQNKRIDSVFAKLIELDVRNVLFSKRRTIRYTITSVAIQKQDVKSFVFAAARATEELVAHNSKLSIYIKDSRARRLNLFYGESRAKTRRSDMFVDLETNHPIARVVETGKPVFFPFRELDPASIDSANGAFRNAALAWPIRYNSSDASSPTSNAFDTEGVILISDIMRKDDREVWPSRATMYDNLMLSYFAEILYIIISHQQKQGDTTRNFQLFTHSISASFGHASSLIKDIESSLFLTEFDSLQMRTTFHAAFKRIEGAENDAMKELRLFQERNPNFKADPKSRWPDPESIFQKLLDAQNALDEIQFQIDKVVGTHESISLDSVQLLPDVLMPLIRLAPSLAKVKSKKPPLFNNFKHANFDRAPMVHSNAKVLLSVFRNLLDNSVKYSPQDQAKINLTWRLDTQAGAPVLVVSYSDDGIGIDPNDLEKVFWEGWQSRRALDLDTSGVGWGMSYSREVLKMVESEIAAKKAIRGAHFEVTLPLSRKTRQNDQR